MSASVRALLETMVGPDTLRPPGEVEEWRTGAGDGGLPAAVLIPSSEEEMAQALGTAGEEGWSVLPAGLGRWLEGGGPSDVTVVVSTRRMRKIEAYEPADLTFSAGAGLSLDDLGSSTRPNGQWLPLDPPGGASGSLGAAVAMGGNGSLRHLYGTARDHVLGLTLVSGEGKILRWGGRVVKNVAGFDMTRLCTGSWGTLGVITSVSARLFPVPNEDVTLVFPSSEVKAALPAARSVALSSMPVAAVELFDSLAVSPAVGGGAPAGESGPGLVVRLLGSEAMVAEMEARLRSDLSGDLGEPRGMRGEASRDLHAALTNWERGADLVVRMSLLPSELATLLEESEILGTLVGGGSGEGPRSRVTAHVGAGILRFGVWGLPEADTALDRWASALMELRVRLENGGGSLVVSSGPRALMEDVGAWGTRGGEAQLVDGLKARFDPHRVMAPGRLGL